MVPHFSYPKIIYKGKVEYDDLKVKIFFFSYGYESSKYYMKKINTHACMLRNNCCSDCCH